MSTSHIILTKDIMHTDKVKTTITNNKIRPIDKCQLIRQSKSNNSKLFLKSGNLNLLMQWGRDTPFLHFSLRNLYSNESLITCSPKYHTSMMENFASLIFLIFMNPYFTCKRHFDISKHFKSTQ